MASKELATSPPRQLRSAASNGSFTSGGTLKLKQGRPRAPVPVSVMTNDPLWDAAARSVPSGDSAPTSPVQTLSDFPPPPPPLPAPVPRPQLEIDLSSLPPPRRRVRKDHLQRCITLQHGMLRESRALDNEPDVLARLSLYDDTLSPLDLLGAASAVEPPLREEDEYAFDTGPRTAPSIMGHPPLPRARRSPAPSPARTPQHEQPRAEYFPTMAEILAAQDAEDAAQASLDASRTPDRSPMPPSSPSGTLMAVDDASSTHLQFPASLYPDLEPPRSAMSFPQTPAYTESIFPLSEKHQSLYPDTEPPNSATFPNTPAYTRSIFPLTSERHHSLYPETEAPHSPSDSLFPSRDRHRSLYPETEAPRSPSELYHDTKHISMQYPETEAPRSPADSVFPRPSLQYPETEAPRSPADSVFPGAPPSLFYPETEAPRSPSINERHSLLPPARPESQQLPSETPAYSAMVFPHTPGASTVAHLSHATSLDAFVFPPRAELNQSTSTLTPSTAKTSFGQPEPSTPASSYDLGQEEEDPDTDGEFDIVSPRRPPSMLSDAGDTTARPLSAHFQSEPRHSVLTMGYPETEPRLSAMYEQLSGAPLLTATTARFSGLSVAATSRGVPSLSPTVAYEQVMTLLHPPSPQPAPSEYISKPIPLQEQPVHLQFPRSTPPEKTQFDQRPRKDSLPFARPRNDSLDQRSRNGSFDMRARNDSLDRRPRADSIDQRQRNDSLPSRPAHESLQVPATPMSPPAPTPPPKTNSVLRLAQRVQAQREEESVRAFHLPTGGRREDAAGPPPIPLPAAPPAPAPTPVGLPSHPAQHVRGLSNASVTAPLQLTLPHQRKGSLQPASAAPSSFKFAPPAPERPGMNRSQSEQSLRQKALLGALRAESGYFDTDEEDSGKGEEEDALEALKREMIEWREGVARESEKRALAEQEAAKRKVLEEKRVPLVEELQAKTPPRKVRKKRVPVVEMCERCGFERDSGECVLAHATPGPVVGLVRRSSSRSVAHERKDSGASSIGGARGLQRRATVHDRKDSASSTIGAPRHAHDRRDSLARLNSALFASTAPSAPPKTAPVTNHERTMSMMSGMSNASSFFSSDINEIVLPGGRSFVSALEKLNTVSTTSLAAPSLRPARSTERLPLPPPVTTPTAASHKRGQSTEKFPSLRPMPSTERFAPPPPPSTLKKMPSTERFASVERFAAFRERFGAGSDSTHNTFVTATQAGTSDFSHTAPPLSSEASTVVAYASVSASASAESSWSSFPPTPADADWEYAFSSTKPGLQRQVSQQQLRGQRSQEAMRRAVGPALGSATISSTRGRALAQQASVYVPEDERDAEPEPQPKSASRWSEDSTRHAPRDKVPSKQASRTNLNSPSVTRLVRAPSVHSPGGGGSESPGTPASGGGAFSGLAKRLRLKSLPSKKNQSGGGSGFGFSRLGTLVVKNKNSAQEMRSGWMG